MNGGPIFLSNCKVPSILSLSIFIPRSKRVSIRIKAVQEKEIRVCMSKTCRKQGSMQTLEILSGIAPPDISVNSCGCLGRCGAGPNIVVLPEGAFIGHCGTAARAADIMVALIGGSGSDGDSSRILDALALRKKAEIEFNNGNYSEALILLSQAIDLKPLGGIHILVKDRASAKLAVCDYSGALEDVKEALNLALRYSEAYLCQGDIFLVMGEVDAAEKSYSMSLDIDPSLRRSKSFKARIVKLEEKLVAANTL